MAIGMTLSSTCVHDVENTISIDAFRTMTQIKYSQSAVMPRTRLGSDLAGALCRVISEYGRQGPARQRMIYAFDRFDGFLMPDKDRPRAIPSDQERVVGHRRRPFHPG